jgi:predicted GIY-YIG superfamily endonuclease
MLYVLKTQDGRYYNGRAANWDGNLTEDKRDAFAYSKEVAEFRAANFNSFTKVHGFNFEVVSL